jgi:starch phosphorylase
VKGELIQYVNRTTDARMDADILAIGFARRATPYKRGELFFQYIERLRTISSKPGPFQIIYGGKAHPQDRGSKELIKRIFQAKELLKDNIRIAYFEDHDIELGKMITGGVDLWLNTPQPPMEASGTSGMKSALNGAPSLSVLDGWWIEGHIEGVTGWSIGETRRDTEESSNWLKDASSLYEKLEHNILPLLYRDRDGFVNVMRHCIVLYGSFFNTHRMILEYVLKAYFR